MEETYRLLMANEKWKRSRIVQKIQTQTPKYAIRKKEVKTIKNDN